MMTSDFMILPRMEVSMKSGEGQLVTFDAGAGQGSLATTSSAYKTSGGPVKIVATMGVRVNQVSHAYTGFRVQHFSDAGLCGSSSLGVDLYILKLGYRF